MVTIPLIQFGLNAPCKFWGVGTPMLGESRCPQGADDSTVRWGVPIGCKW